MPKLQTALLVAGVAAVGAVSGLMTSWMFGGVVSAAPAYLEAREFRLVDESGAVRGRFGTDSDGTTRLAISDPQGVPRLWSGVMPDGTAMINLNDASGNPRVFIQVNDTEPLFAMRDSENTGRIYLQVNQDEPLINLRDANNQGRIFIKVGEQGPAIWFNDEQGRTVFTQR
jgi:hypothetical protein